eukprot:scaffold537_cov241-Pinguiococcus_pyrenoidosus.AAC.7
MGLNASVFSINEEVSNALLEAAQREFAFFRRWNAEDVADFRSNLREASASSTKGDKTRPNAAEVRIQASWPTFYRLCRSVTRAREIREREGQKAAHHPATSGYSLVPVEASDLLAQAALVREEMSRGKRQLEASGSEDQRQSGAQGAEGAGPKYVRDASQEADDLETEEQRGGNDERRPPYYTDDEASDADSQQSGGSSDDESSAGGEEGEKSMSEVVRPAHLV